MNANLTQMITDRQTALLNAAHALLQQGSTALHSLSDAQYAMSGTGGHWRHVLEFYDCLLDGLAEARIDYTARRRDPALETCRSTALARIAVLQQRLAAPSLLSDRILYTRAESAAEPGLSSWTISSLGRELDYLSSHTTHHYALIALLLKEIAVALPREFGVAPSTLRYRRQQSAEAA